MTSIKVFHWPGMFHWPVHHCKCYPTFTALEKSNHSSVQQNNPVLVFMMNVYLIFAIIMEYITYLSVLQTCILGHVKHGTERKRDAEVENGCTEKFLHQPHGAPNQALNREIVPWRTVGASVLEKDDKPLYITWKWSSKLYDMREVTFQVGVGGKQCSIKVVCNSVAKPSPPEIATYPARNKLSICTYGNANMQAMMDDHVDFDRGTQIVATCKEKITCPVEISAKH
ncbi:hypothetical protein EI94DRAFT_1699858 [Lactarius quietus]|nr:hypothetical protein EI94DRAFT_1699858 [Lactarius quietus]